MQVVFEVNLPGVIDKITEKKFLKFTTTILITVPLYFDGLKFKGMFNLKLKFLPIL